MKTLCNKCNSQILISTAEANDGMCVPCSKGAGPCSVCGIRVWVAKPSGEHLCVDCEFERENGRRSDKLFLRKFTTGTLEELLVKEDDYHLDSLLLCLEERLERKKEHSDEELLILSLVGFEREVDHGGFETYLTNSSIAYADRAISDLKAVDLTELSKVIALCFLNMGLSKAPTLTEIEELTDKDCFCDDELYADACNEVDEYFYNNVSTLAPQLFDWVKQNKEAISI